MSLIEAKINPKQRTTGNYCRQIDSDALLSPKGLLGSIDYEVLLDNCLFIIQCKKSLYTLEFSKKTVFVMKIQYLKYLKHEITQQKAGTKLS